MRKFGAEPAQITPTPSGWRLHLGAEPEREAVTLEEVAKNIPEGAHVELSLPCHAALLERLTLPSKDREELAGMLGLHLEKTLPYPVEEVRSDFQVIRTGDNESVVLALAAHGPLLTKLCEPLRAAGHLPELVSVFALDLVPHLPSGKVVAAVWAEQDHLAIAIYENEKLSWAYNLLGTDAAMLQSDLPPLLLTAEVDGVPTTVKTVALASDCAALRPVLAEIFHAPVESFPIELVRPRREINLLPADWTLATQRQERSARLRQRLLMAAVVYLLLIAAAFVYLAWTKHGIQVLDAQIAQLLPAVQTTTARQAAWLSLAPALEPRRYPVEVLYLVNKNRPGEVRITLFDSAPGQFTVEGEAPNAGQAIDFVEKLRAEKELAEYRFESEPPKILPNDHAQFRIFGQL